MSKTACDDPVKIAKNIPGAFDVLIGAIGSHLLFSDIWAVPCENLSSGICGQRRPRSDCAFAQSDQGLNCPLEESFATT